MQMLANNQAKSGRGPTHASAKTIRMRSIKRTNPHQILRIWARSFARTQTLDQLNAADTSQHPKGTKSMLQRRRDGVNTPRNDISHTAKSRKRIVTQNHHISDAVLPSIPPSVNWTANMIPSHTTPNNLIAPQLPQREAIMAPSLPHPLLPSPQEGGPSAPPPSWAHLRIHQQPTAPPHPTINLIKGKQKMPSTDASRPLSRAELAARHIAQHFYSTTTPQQHLALRSIDHRCHNNPTPPTSIQSESFPWLPTDLMKATVPTQYCKLVEFYQMICSFVAQSMQGPNPTTSQEPTIGHAVSDRLQRLDQHITSLSSHFQLLQNAQHDLRGDVQHLQRNIDTLLQHCGLLLQQKEGSALHPIAIEDDDDTAQ